MRHSELPAWASWIAMDEDGAWWCYEAEPHQHEHGWYENEVGRSQKLARTHPVALYWKESLTRVGQEQ